MNRLSPREASRRGERPRRTAVVLAVSVGSALAILVSHLHNPQVGSGPFAAALLEAWLLLGFVPTLVFYALGRVGGRHPVLLVATWFSTTAVFSVYAVVGALVVVGQAACVPGLECFG